MSQYWIANNPGSTVTSSEAERVAVLGRSLNSSGTVDVKTVVISSTIAQPTEVFYINLTPTSGLYTTSSTGSAAGTNITLTSQLVAGTIGGYIRIKIKSSTGGTPYRYIALFTTTESS